ncbi:MAG: hypothetical protein KDE45_13075, partial [Caldilineaceae bacterium]|nr:hypothetical protein [Caldilineaceae bacterium]
ATWEEIPRWSNFIDLWPELYPGEVPALCVTEGNRLHLVWNVLEEKQDGSVYRTVVYSTRTVDAQVVPSHGFISLSFEPSLGEQSSSSQVSAEETRAQTPLPRAIGENFADNPQTVSVSDRNLTILLGVTPAMCFVVVVIGLQLRRRRFRD